MMMISKRSILGNGMSATFDIKKEASPLVLALLQKDLVKRSEARLYVVIGIPTTISCLASRQALIKNMLYIIILVT